MVRSSTGLRVSSPPRFPRGPAPSLCRSWSSTPRLVRSGRAAALHRLVRALLCCRPCLGSLTSWCRPALWAWAAASQPLSEASFTSSLSQLACGCVWGGCSHKLWDGVGVGAARGRGMGVGLSGSDSESHPEPLTFLNQRVVCSFSSCWLFHAICPKPFPVNTSGPDCPQPPSLVTLRAYLPSVNLPNRFIFYVWLCAMRSLPVCQTN